MPVSRSRHISAIPAAAAITAALASALGAQTPADGKRPMTFLDQQNMRQIGAPAPSPDRKALLYTISVPDWNQARRQTDIYVVSMDQGVPSTRQLTYTKDKSEGQPRWAPDGSFFLFSSNRDAPPAGGGAGGGEPGGGGGGGGPGGGGGGGAGFQLYMMNPNGGEARKITDAREGVSTFAFSEDGKSLVYRSGKAGEEQLYRMPVAGIDSAKAEQITRHPTGVGIWRFAPTGNRIYFITADTIDLDEKLRREKRFTVNVRNPETPTSSLWAFDVDGKKTTRLTKDTSITVTGFDLSPDGKFVSFRGISSDRYKRNVTEQGINGDNYLLDVASGQIERLTNNVEVNESVPSFSPDSKWLAFSGPDDLSKYSMKNSRVYIRAVTDKGGQWRKLGSAFDGDVSVGFWSEDASKIYFNEGIRVTNQVLVLDVASGKVTQLTNEKASIAANYDEDTKTILINYADPKTPNTIFSVSSIDQIGNRSSWKQLTDANPQLKNVALGEEEEITWKSSDGRTVGGVLVKPVGYRQGQRYPLIVAIHGGPAVGRRARVQRRLRRAVVRRRGLRGAQAELPWLDELRREAQDGHRRRLLPARLRRHHDGRESPHRAGPCRQHEDGRARLERGWSLVELDPHAHEPVQGDQLGRRHVELDLDVRAERRAAEPTVLPRQQAPVRRLRRVLEPVADQVHQEREDADDDPRGRGRSARAEPAVRGTPHGAQEARRGDGTLHVSGQQPRHP